MLAAWALVKSALKPLIKASRDKYFGVRAEAAKALGKIGGKKAEKVLCRMIRDTHSWVRRTVADTLGEAAVKGDAATLEKIEEALISILEDEDGLVRTAASAALKKIRENPAHKRERKGKHK